MEERRMSKRRNLIFYLQVFDQSTDELLGFAVDITPEGLMLLSNKPIDTGHDFTLRMTLPEEFSESNQIEFKAKSIWCEQDVNTDYYDTGFQLVDVEPETVSLIHRLTRHFGFKN